MENDTLIALTSDIVSAHVSNNSVAIEDLPLLIQSVHAALEGAGKTAPPAAIKLEPAVSIRSSVKPDAITCLECGFKGKMLKRHLGSEHGLSAADYRMRWNLPSDYPLVAPEYAARRRDLAKTIGLGRKPEAPAGRKAGRKPKEPK